MALLLALAAEAVPGGLAALWRGAALREVREDWVAMRMDCADFADYWEPLTGGQGPVGTYVVGLAEGLRQRIREQVRQAFLSGTPDGPRSLVAATWVVRGVIP